MGNQRGQTMRFLYRIRLYKSFLCYHDETTTKNEEDFESALFKATAYKENTGFQWQNLTKSLTNLIRTSVKLSTAL